MTSLLFPLFQGVTFDPAQDEGRLTKQLDKVRALMADNRWRTLRQIANATGAPEASGSARLRDLRRLGFAVNRRRVAGEHGLYEYQVQGVMQ